MFGINNVLHKSDRMLNYYEIQDIIDKLVKLDDIKTTDAINNLETKIQKKLENAMIYLYDKKDKTKDELILLDKYNNYVLNEINKDGKKIMNNSYFSFVLSIIEQSDNKTVLGKNLDDIINIFDNELDNISKKILNDKILSKEEQEFYENSTIFIAINSFIDSSDIQEINCYFNNYPVKNLDDNKNKQLFILFLLCKNIVEIGGNVCIKFNDDLEIDSNKFVTFGNFGRLADGRYLLEINDIDSYNLNDDSEFYRLIFTIFHELGHLNQDINYDKYSNDDKRRMDVEKVFLNQDRDFYIKHHDNFFVEQDANMYAIKILLNEFGEIKEVLDICKKKLKSLESVYNQDIEFSKLEYELYNSIENFNNKNK